MAAVTPATVPRVEGAADAVAGHGAPRARRGEGRGVDEAVRVPEPVDDDLVDDGVSEIERVRLDPHRGDRRVRHAPRRVGRREREGVLAGRQPGRVNRDRAGGGVRRDVARRDDRAGAVVDDDAQGVERLPRARGEKRDVDRGRARGRSGGGGDLQRGDGAVVDRDPRHLLPLVHRERRDVRVHAGDAVRHDLVRVLPRREREVRHAPAVAPRGGERHAGVGPAVPAADDRHDAVGARRVHPDGQPARPLGHARALGGAAAAPGGEARRDGDEGREGTKRPGHRGWCSAGLGGQQDGGGGGATAFGSLPRQVGSFADAVGSLPRAVGSFADAVGSLPRAVGSFADAVGSLPLAVGSFADAVGSLPLAVGSFAFAVGSLPLAVGSFAVAVGSLPPAVGSFALAVGSLPPAVGSFAVAVGSLPPAVSSFAFAVGALPRAVVSDAGLA